MEQLSNKTIMKLIKRTLILCIWLLTFPFLNLFAQDEDQYKMELGGALGGSFYMGDANYTTPFKNLGVAGGIMARYIINPRMALKSNLTAGQISGSTKDFKNKYPDNGEVSFKRTLFDLGLQFEYNFLGYGTGYGFRGEHRFTPYILGGLGFTYAPAPAEGVFTLNFPVGVGVKYKLARRLNIGCEFTMRFSLSDKLDVTNKEELQLNDPYRIKSGGWKNKDSYSYTVFFITYDLFSKCKECNN